MSERTEQGVPTPTPTPTAAAAAAAKVALAGEAGTGPLHHLPELLDWRHKGLPVGTRVRSDQVAEQGWSLTAGDTGTPVAVLRADAVRHNVESMRAFCARHEVLLAPHVKTTMSPELMAMQLAAGAWGLTVAVPHQAAVLLAIGAPRVLVANEIGDPAAARRLVEQAGAAGAELWCYVDSVPGVHLLERALAGTERTGAGPGRLPVLLEVGYPAGRTGVRGDQEALLVARAVQDSRVLRLAGVAGFEGLIGADRDAATLSAVDGFLDRIARLFLTLRDQGRFGPGELVVSAGGSAFFDRVVEVLGPLRAQGASVLLRSGCYLTQDDGFYHRVTPAVAERWGAAALRPALEVWGRVVSRPEPDLALLDAGRRDLSHDLGLPVARWRVRDGVRVAARGLEVTGLADQHTFVRVDPAEPETADLVVGDLVGLGVSHPCTTFDKWRVLLLVDDQDRVTGVVRTVF